MRYRVNFNGMQNLGEFRTLKDAKEWMERIDSTGCYIEERDFDTGDWFPVKSGT